MYNHNTFTQVEQITAAGLLTNNTVINQHMFYAGDSMLLQSRLEDIQSNHIPVKTAEIRIKGAQIKQKNIWVCIAICLLGACLIFPYFLLCFDYWTQIVSAAFSIPVSTYKKLQTIINNSSIVSLTLQVKDNTFDEEKAKILYEMLSRSSIKGFKFENKAGHYNFKKNQWSNFSSNMKPIKSLPLISELQWHDQLVI